MKKGGFLSSLVFVIEGINFAAYDIYSMYQPDAIKYTEVAGVGYIITANEGADQKYEADGNTWEEAKRGEKFVDGRQILHIVATKGLVNTRFCKFRQSQ